MQRDEQGRVGRPARGRGDKSVPVAMVTGSNLLGHGGTPCRASLVLSYCFFAFLREEAEGSGDGKSERKGEEREGGFVSLEI